MHIPPALLQLVHWQKTQLQETGNGHPQAMRGWHGWHPAVMDSMFLAAIPEWGRGGEGVALVSQSIILKSPPVSFSSPGRVLNRTKLFLHSQVCYRKWRLFCNLQNLTVTGKGKGRRIGSTAFVFLYYVFEFSVVYSGCWIRRSAMHTAMFSCLPWESSTFCLASWQDVNKDTVWGGPKATNGQININKEQEERELSSFYTIPVEQYSWAEQGSRAA